MSKILFIDDDPDIVTVTKFLLEDAQFQVLTAESAEEGLAILERELPDILLLDLFLPKMQGWELSKLLKDDERYKHIPIIIFTANAGITAKTTHEMGAEDFIVKPFDENVLIEKIKKQIR